MKKRLLGLVLSVVFIFTCVPFINADAQTIAVYDDDYKNAELVLKSICPAFPLAEGNITTRAEFVASVVETLNMPAKTILQTGFSDVSADMQYADRIAYARDLELISNVDLFYPNSPITYEQAIKIVMSACGYGKKAELTGGFPAGYIKAANDAGVGKNLNKANADYLTHKEATELIFEACITDMLEVTSFGDSFDYSLTEGKNIFSVYHKIYMAEGVVEANENSGLRSISAASAEGFIKIDSLNYMCESGINFLGKNVRVFYKDGVKNEVVCIYECGNETFEYAQDDELTLSGSVITAYPKDSQKEIKHNLEDDYTIIYNGKCFNTPNPQSLISSVQGRVSLTDNNDNGSTDVIIIKEYKYSIAGSINEFEEKIYDKFKRNGVLDLSQMNYNIFDADGSKIELGDLEDDDALGIAISKDGLLCEIVRYTEKLGGTIDEITSDGKIVVGTSEYQLSSYYIEVIKPLSELTLGSEVILVFGDDGKVIYINEYSSDINYGFFVGAAPGSGLGSKEMVMIFGADGKMKEMPIAEKISVDGNKKSRAEAYPLIEAIKERAVILRVIKYTQNASGELKSIYTAKQNTEGTKVFLTRTQNEAQPVLYDDNTKHGYVETASSSSGKLVFKNDVFYPYFTMAPECVILKVPKNEDERFNNKYYSLSQTSEVRDAAAANGDSVECYGYDVDIEGASFILWPSDVGGSLTVAEETSNAIVEKLTRGISPDGSDCWVITLFADGKAEKYYSTTDSEAVVSTMKPGDIVQVSHNAEKEITAANINFVWQTKTISGNAQAPQGYNGARVGLAAGYFYNFSGKTGMIVRGKTINEIANATTAFEFTDMFPANLGRGKIYFVKFTYNRINGNIEEAVVHTKSDTSSIESFYTAGKDADYMVQRARFHDISYTVVYTN